jgi:hypothetical protein
MKVFFRTFRVALAAFLTTAGAFVASPAASQPAEYGFPESGEEEEIAIDAETAAKLAMVVSYHSEYGQSLRFNLKKYGKSPRVLVDSLEMTSLDGTDKYYAITLYRGVGEPESPEEIEGRVGRWAEAMLSLSEKADEGVYTLKQPTREMTVDPATVYFFDSMDEFLDYYSCAVPASTRQGFLFEFHRGISPYWYLGAFGRLVLAADLGVEPAEVSFKRTAPEFWFLYEVAGEDYIVDLSKFNPSKSFEIIKGDAVAAAVEQGWLESDAEPVEVPVEEAAKEEDIVEWLYYVEKVGKKYGFGVGPSITADAVNPVLMGHYVRTLYQDGASLNVLFDSRHPPEEKDE